MPKKKKRQPNELEKICASNITNKGLILKIYKELIQLNIKNNKQPNLKKKIGRGPGKFFKEDIDCQKTHERMCHITNYQGNEISKSTMRYHLTPVRMVMIKNTTSNKSQWGCGEKRTFRDCCCECYLIHPSQKTKRRFLKKLNYHMIQQFHSSKEV